MFVAAEVLSYGKADVNIAIAPGLTFTFLALCVGIIPWIFQAG